jgi:hypothetical protein
MTTTLINTFTASWPPRWIVRNTRMRKVIESIFVVNSLYCFTAVHEWGSVEMYTCSNTSSGRKRKNRCFFFIFKTPPLFFYYNFSFKHVRSDHSHRALLSRPLTLFVHLCFLWRLQTILLCDVFSYSLIIIVDKVRDRGENVKMCRCGESQRDESGGWWSPSHSKWSGGTS